MRKEATGGFKRWKSWRCGASARVQRAAGPRLNGAETSPREVSHPYSEIVSGHEFGAHREIKDMQHHAIMKKVLRYSVLSFLSFVLLLASQPALAQGSVDAEANFVAMLKNATLKGTWAPVQQAQLGTARKDEGYRIARVEKKEGDKWSLVYLVNYQGKEFEYPMPVTVKFAGDTSVLILDNVRAGRDKANWSARVMFHENVYVGRWWETGNKEHGGTIEGVVTHAK